ncbi:PREDICTED: acetylcholine receptor subunit alpha-like [Priapulus caudatus]|uniref:Acetylcholine receptor subunit alpha-like n=1 Tax=Priapulus caudatus TaxID=37621 RepID=A0ABM1DZ30_PRICU|nr:PREDICTED: acetylcholine receptor subunit alpha-like [Priapulus caudatus]
MASCSLLTLCAALALLLCANDGTFARAHVPGTPGGHGSNAETRLVQDLLTTHMPLARPIINASESVLVEIGMQLKKIMKIDESQSTIHVRAWLIMVWKNAQMTWNPDDYEGITQVTLPSPTVWKPDIRYIFSIVPGFYSFPDMPLTVTSDGRTRWSPPTDLVVLCDMHLDFFPFDRQTCHFTFGSLTHDATRLDVALKDNVSVIDLSWYHASVGWRVEDTLATRHAEVFACCPDPFVDVTFTLTVRRDSAMSYTSLVLPLGAVQAVTLLVFWVPPGSREKLTAAMTNLVALTVLSLQMSQQVPPLTGKHVPVIVKYFAFTYLMVAISVGAAVIVLNLHYRRPRYCVRPVPAWVNKVFIDGLGRLCRLRSNAYGRDGRVPLTNEMMDDDDRHLTDLQRPVTDANNDQRQNNERLHEMLLRQQREQAARDTLDEWAKVAIVVDRLLFTIYLVCFIFSWVAMSRDTAV